MKLSLSESLLKNMGIDIKTPYLPVIDIMLHHLVKHNVLEDVIDDINRHTKYTCTHDLELTKAAAKHLDLIILSQHIPSALLWLKLMPKVMATDSLDIIDMSIDEFMATTGMQGKTRQALHKNTQVILNNINGVLFDRFLTVLKDGETLKFIVSKSKDPEQVSKWLRDLNVQSMNILDAVCQR